YCWGEGGNGRLGNGSTTSENTSPVAVSQGNIPAGATIRQLATGHNHTCAIASDNWVYCWGQGTNGRLGNGGTSDQTKPVAVSQGNIPSGATILHVTAGASHTCVVASNNQAYCWGYGDYGRLGNGGTSDQTTPVAVSQGNIPSDATIREITAGEAHSCVVASN